MRKRKIKRYNGEDESYVEDYASLGKRASQKDDDYAYDPISKVTGEAEMSRAERLEKMDQGGGERGPKPMPGETKQTFKQAFAEARRSGDKSFTWKGKNYTTELAKSKPLEDERTAERRMTAIGDKWRESKAVPKASAAEMERRKQMERSQALETVAPEANLIGGPGLKMAQKGAQALAAREAAKNVVKRRIEPSFRPIKDITPGAESIGMAPRQIGMKKGGKVSSASSRADGCAQRGKTKGRIV